MEGGLYKNYDRRHRDYHSVRFLGCCHHFLVSFCQIRLPKVLCDYYSQFYDSIFSRFGRRKLIPAVLGVALLLTLILLLIPRESSADSADSSVRIEKNRHDIKRN